MTGGATPPRTGHWSVPTAPWLLRRMMDEWGPAGVKHAVDRIVTAETRQQVVEEWGTEMADLVVPDAPDRDFVVLPRGALLEFLGEMALPPWTDVDGSTIGGHIDCAPIAERLTTWLQDHDLSDLYLHGRGGAT